MGRLEELTQAVTEYLCVAERFVEVTICDDAMEVFVV